MKETQQWYVAYKRPNKIVSLQGGLAGLAGQFPARYMGSLVQGQAEVVSDATKMLKTCERLMSAGFLQSKVYNIEAPEEDIDDVDDKDFKTRFCDQETSGGGWTVPEHKIVFIVIVTFVGTFYAVSICTGEILFVTCNI